MFSTALDVRHYAFHKSHTQEVLHEKKRKLQTLPSAKEQLILLSSSPGSLVSLWHPRGVIWHLQQGVGFILFKVSPRKQELGWSEMLSSKQRTHGAAQKSLEAADPTDLSVCV